MWLRLGVAVCLALVPTTLAKTQTITLYNTNPRISYTPDLTCTPRRLDTWPLWRKCISKNNPWSLRVYQDISGQFQSMHSATSFRNDEGGGGVREISFYIQAGRVLIFGAPRSQIDLLPANQELCIDQYCTSIDVQEIYSREESADSPVLIYAHYQSDQNLGHHFVLRMTEHPSGKGHPERVMSLDRIVYQFESPEDVVESLPPGHYKKNITSEDHNVDADFGPRRAWKRVLYEVVEGDPEAGGVTSTKSFMHSATTYPLNKGEYGNQQASFQFKGSALYIYGAPPSQIQYPHGSLEICVDRVCHAIDAHHLYLNVGSRPPPLGSLQSPISSTGYVEDQPVLLWSSDKLDPRSWHDVIYKLTEPNPKYPDNEGGIIKGITLHSITYTWVHFPPPPEIPKTPRLPETHPSPETPPPPETPRGSILELLAYSPTIFLAGCGMIYACLSLFLAYVAAWKDNRHNRDRDPLISSRHRNYNASANWKPPPPKGYHPRQQRSRRTPFSHEPHPSRASCSTIACSSILCTASVTFKEPFVRCCIVV